MRKQTLFKIGDLVRWAFDPDEVRMVVAVKEALPTNPGMGRKYSLHPAIRDGLHWAWEGQLKLVEDA